MTHKHNDLGQLTEFTDADNATISFGYGSHGQLTTIVDRRGGTNHYSYDGNSGLITSITDANGTMTLYGYQQRNYRGVTLYDVSAITFPDGSKESYNWSDGVLTQAIDRNNHQRKFSYNSRGQLLTYTNPAGGVTTNTYSPNGELATRTDPSGNTTEFTYDTFDRITQITHADSTAASYVYDDGDHLISQENERNITTTYSYDTNGNLVQQDIGSGDSLTLRSYDDMDRLITETSGSGGVDTFGYSVVGQVERLTDANNITTRFVYDSLQRPVAYIDGDNNQWLRQTDAEGHISTATTPDNRGYQFSIDNVGRISSITDPLSALHQIEYDILGRITAEIQADGKRISRSYDNRGLLIALSSGNTEVGFSRNALGKVASINDANGNNWSIDHDNHGRISSESDPLSREMTFSYNSRNWIDTVTFPGAAGNLDIAYDAVGNTAQIDYSDSAPRLFEYDSLNRLITAEGISLTYDAVGDMVNSNGITLTRDPGGRITRVTLAQGKTVDYSYNGRNQVTKVVDWTGDSMQLGYDSAGRLSTLTRANGRTTELGYDMASRLKTVEEGGDINISLQRDKMGRITSAIRELPLKASVKNISIDQGYSYDQAAQLDNVDFDTLGRQITGINQNFTWDLASRLLAHTFNGVVTNHQYDALHHRIASTTAGNTVEYTINYGFDLSVVAIHNNAGSVRYYVHLPDGLLLYSIEAGNDQHYYYHYDELGNTTFLSDSNGDIVASYAYGAFGELIDQTGEIDNIFTWQGMFGVVQEGESGLFYMRTRYYDSTSGRFLSKDPIRKIDLHSSNPYLYARANPLFFNDPPGMEFQVTEPFRGSNCHGWALFGGVREVENEEIHQVIQQEYVEVDPKNAQPGDVILYDYHPGSPDFDTSASPSHTGLVIDVEDGIKIIGKGSAIAGIKVHRPGEYGGAGEGDWRIFRRKSLQIDQPTQDSIENRQRRLRRACSANPDGPRARKAALDLGKLIQDLNYHGPGRVLEAPNDERRLDSTLFNPAGQLFPMPR